jgi:hypothetical protein
MGIYSLDGGGLWMRMRLRMRLRQRAREKKGIGGCEGEDRRKEDDSRCYGEYIRNSIVGCGIEKSGMAGQGMAWHGEFFA